MLHTASSSALRVLIGACIVNDMRMKLLWHSLSSFTMLEGIDGWNVIYQIKLNHSDGI